MPLSPGQVPVEVSARLRAAEARLYPLAMVDPDAYERATALVGLVVGELGSCADVDEVWQRCEVVRSGLPDLAEGAGLGRAELPVDVILDAAAAIRCRQLEAISPVGWPY